MKKFWVGAIGFCCVSFSALAENPASASSQTSGAAAYNVTERGANYRVWERTENETLPSGKIVSRVHRFTELATGLHYWDSNLNAWADSVERVVPVSGGAEATQGQHKVYFPYDIYSGVIEMVTPQGQDLKSRPLGISYFDGTNSVLIAELTNSIGQILPSGNQVIYTNAFTDLPADLVMTYRKSGFESDLIFRGPAPPPEAFGLDPRVCRIQLLTEWFGSTEPAQVRTRPDPQTALSDTLEFGGGTKMIHGRAFATGATNADVKAAVPVFKSWVHLPDTQNPNAFRTFLIEEIPFYEIRSQLESLRASASSTIRTASLSPARRKGSLAQLLPRAPSTLARARTGTLRLAQASLNQQPGFVLDYIIVNSDITGFTFRGDTTYFISGPVHCSDATIEGGTVLKYPNDTTANLEIDGTITCLTSPYRAAVFTAADDDSVGESVAAAWPGYTGAISGYYGNPALEAYNELSNLRIYYAQQAILAWYGDDIAITDSQIINCANGVGLAWQGSTATLKNCLFAGDGVALTGGGPGSSFDLYFCTIDGSGELVGTGWDDSSPGDIYAVNSIFSNIGEYGDGSLSGGYNGFHNAPSHFGDSPIPGDNDPQIFTSSGFRGDDFGGGYYYLADSTFRGQGTTSPTYLLDSTVLDEIRKRTTHPPQAWDYTSIDQNTVLGPQALPDTGALPDLGYHYDRLDHAFCSASVSASLTFAPGTVVGWGEMYQGEGGGITLAQGGMITFNGMPDNPCYFVPSAGVVDLDQAGDCTGISSATAVSPPTVNASFTRFCQIGSDNYFGTIYNSLAVSASNCEFRNGSICEPYTGFSFNLFNSLLDENDLTFAAAVNVPSCSLKMVNCTLSDGSLHVIRFGSGSPINVGVTNCALDETVTTVNENAYIACANNAYLSGYTPFPNDTADPPPVTTFGWQSGPLGDFYLPSDTTLHSAGAYHPAELGLQDYTTQITLGAGSEGTKQMTETVDIGYHHLALDVNGNMIDSNGDGLPDWWVRLYGIDPTVTVNAADPSDPLGAVGDPDGDGVDNYHEYLNGTSPVRPNNTTPGGAYKKLALAANVPAKAYDVYYRADVNSAWRRISSSVPGQKAFTVVNPNPDAEGDYIFLDAADYDEDGLSDGYENWFTYNGQRTLPEQPDSNGDQIYDAWAVAHGLDPLSASDPNGAAYILPGDTLDNFTKYKDYGAKLAVSQPYYATYDPLNVAGTAAVRPVVSISQLTQSAYNVGMFTISRDVGGDASGNTPSDLAQRLSHPLTVYFALGGDLLYGTDFTIDPAPTQFGGIYSTAIPSGQTCVTLTVVAGMPTQPQGVKSLIVTLVSIPQMQ